jgi:hypothetical protein
VRDGRIDSRSLGTSVGNPDGSPLGSLDGSLLGSSVGMLKEGLGEPPVLALFCAGGFFSGEPSPPEAIRTTAATAAAVTRTASTANSGVRRLLGASGAPKGVVGGS